MLQGTGTDVGKSILLAGLCRAYKNRGLVARPFKPQNMSNNAAVASDGGEIGRAQALQARAAKIPSSIHMNPVLLKPQTNVGAQIVVQGKVIGSAKAKDYHALKPQLMPKVLDSFSENLEEIKTAIKNKRGDKLNSIFSSTRKLRKEIIKAGQETNKPNFGRK